MSKRFALLALAVVSFTLPLAAGNGALSTGKPDDLGFSAERLARVREAVQRHVDAGQVSGAVTLVARRGRIAHSTDPAPMTQNAIRRNAGCFVCVRS